MVMLSNEHLSKCRLENDGGVREMNEFPYFVTVFFSDGKHVNLKSKLIRSISTLNGITR